MPQPNFNALGMMGSSGGSGGHTAFGTVPAPIATPPNIFSQVSGAIPNFGNLTQGTSDVIGSELSGNVSPATLKAMQNAAATFGVTSGMPGSGLQQNGLFGNIAGYSEGRQRQGLQDYLGTLGEVGHTMTDPGLAAEIASRNANLAAAPDPQKAAERQLQEWLMKFGLTNQLGGSPSGGTGAFRGGRPPDSVGGGGYHGPTNALGNPITDMSGGAMGNSYYGGNGPIGYGPQGDIPITQHISPQVSSYASGNNIPLPGSGGLGGLQYGGGSGRTYFGPKVPNPFKPGGYAPFDPNELADFGYWDQDITDYYKNQNGEG